MKYLNSYYWLRKIYVSKFFQNFLKKFNGEENLRKLVFKSIYKSNHWNAHRVYNPMINSVSGTGSNPKTRATINLIKNLSKFIDQNNIKKILDAPCGDCAWMKKIWKKFPDVKYIGIDIVGEIIKSNKNKYKNSNIQFSCQDILKLKKLPRCDFLILRDFIIHLPTRDISSLFNLIKKSPIRFFGVNSYSSTYSNIDVLIGKHRKVNIFIEPFNLKNLSKKFKDQKSEFCIFQNR